MRLILSKTDISDIGGFCRETDLQFYNKIPLEYKSETFNVVWLFVVHSRQNDQDNFDKIWFTWNLVSWIGLKHNDTFNPEIKFSHKNNAE